MEVQIDRHNDYRKLSGLFFPHYENPSAALGVSLLDGELVIDQNRRTGQVFLRF